MVASSVAEKSLARVDLREVCLVINGWDNDDDSSRYMSAAANTTSETAVVGGLIITHAREKNFRKKFRPNSFILLSMKNRHTEHAWPKSAKCFPKTRASRNREDKTG